MLIKTAAHAPCAAAGSEIPGKGFYSFFKIASLAFWFTHKEAL